ncbi:MAG: hypothetical protein AB1758_14165 [Candidatus Eremiobacterota bacterium]
MDELLRELRDEGRLDSVGSFTLDFSRAFEKLKRFQSQADQFAVQLVAAARMRGAERIELRCREREFSLAFVGRGYRWKELQSLFQQEQTDPSVFRLNLALLACLGLAPEVIGMDTWDDRRGHRLTVRGNQLEIRALKGAPSPNSTRLYMTLGWRSCPLPTPEAIAVSERCSLCPGLTLNGQAIAPPDVPLGTRGSLAAGLWPARPNLEGDLQAAYFANRPGFTVVLHGVSFPIPDASPWDWLGAAVWCDHLGTDLSFQKLRMDDAADELRSRVEEGLDALLPVVFESQPLHGVLGQRALDYLAGRPGPYHRMARMATLRWGLEGPLEDGLTALRGARAGLTGFELVESWNRTFRQWLEKLEGAQRNRPLTLEECRRLRELWVQVEDLLPDRAPGEGLGLDLLSRDMQRAAERSALAAWAVGYVERARSELGEHPLVWLAEGDLERAEAGFAGSPAWHARCRRLRGLEPVELPSSAQTFQYEWVLAEMLRLPEKPASLRALSPMLKFLGGCADPRLLHSLAERERERYGQSLVSPESEVPPRALNEWLTGAFDLERQGDRRGAEERCLGLLYFSRVAQPAHPATRALALWMGHFYLEHGQFEEGIRHLLWADPHAQGSIPPSFNPR